MHCSLIKIGLTGYTTLFRIDNILCAFNLNISSETVWHHLTPTTSPLYPYLCTSTPFGSFASPPHHLGCTLYTEGVKVQPK